MTQLVPEDRIDADPALYTRMFDRQTGLPRWPLLLDRTAIALARAGRSDRVVGVFVIQDPRTFDGDVPEYAEIANRLQERVRPDDTVARAAHRTFVIVCNDISRDEDAAAVARRLVHGSGVLCQLGVALGTWDENAEALLRRAVKEAGPRPPCVGQPQDSAVGGVGHAWRSAAAAACADWPAMIGQRRPDSLAAASAASSCSSTMARPPLQKPGSARSRPTIWPSSSGEREPPAASISRYFGTNASPRCS